MQKQLTPNYRNLAVLHNWLLNERSRLKGLYHSASWEAKHDGAPMSAFGWAKAQGPAVICANDLDWLGMVYQDRKIYPWPRYMERVFGLSLGMSEYCWIDSCRWREKDDSIDGAIARIRYVIDNALNLPGIGELVDVLAGNKPLPYDTLENRPYDLSKTI